jgi:hypothetical protein
VSCEGQRAKCSTTSHTKNFDSFIRLTLSKCVVARQSNTAHKLFKPCYATSRISAPQKYFAGAFVRRNRRPLQLISIHLHTLFFEVLFTVHYSLTLKPQRPACSYAVICTSRENTAQYHLDTTHHPTPPTLHWPPLILTNDCEESFVQPDPKSLRVW